jgi:hypothetical protein
MASAGNQRKDSLTSRQGVFGGTSYRRYPDPTVSGSGNEYGLYEWSAFRAALGTFSAGTYAAYTGLTNADAVNLLLFTSDIPVLGFCVDVATSAITTPLLVANASCPFLRVTDGSATAVTVAPGEVGRGYVYNGSAYIYCTGFPAAVTTPATPTTYASGVELIVLANSPNIASPVAFIAPVTQSVSTGALPIILSSASYTQDIRDAGNLITDSTGKLYQVVGLYSVTAG